MKFIYLLLISIFILSCSNNMKCKIYLPAHKEIEVCTVEEFQQKFDLKYGQYEGYKGKLDDSVITDFTVYLKNEPDFVKYGNASQDNIKSLSKYELKGIRSQKFPEEQYSEEELSSYIQSNFNIASSKEINAPEEFVEREVQFLNSEGKVIVKLQYAQVGIPGYFIFMLVVEE